jgi:hypothetical protein
VAIANQIMGEEGEDLNERFTFAGGVIFDWMKAQGMYTTDPKSVQDRVARLGLAGYFDKRLA